MSIYLGLYNFPFFLCGTIYYVCKYRKRNEMFNASRGLMEELNAVIEEHDMEWTAVKVSWSIIGKLNKIMFTQLSSNHDIQNCIQI